MNRSSLSQCELPTLQFRTYILTTIHTISNRLSSAGNSCGAAPSAVGCGAGVHPRLLSSSLCGQTGTLAHAVQLYNHPPLSHPDPKMRYLRQKRANFSPMWTS